LIADCGLAGAWFGLAIPTSRTRAADHVARRAELVARSSAFIARRASARCAARGGSASSALSALFAARKNFVEKLSDHVA
jgi:hypothetical protein